ncbi:MAG: hypothetical protein IPL72_06060 [Sulfuritalea sp.]|nr:hypothetical protein [Sulfuritalea sp.]
MNIEKESHPQISPICADGSKRAPVWPHQLPSESRTPATSVFDLRNLRNLRIPLGPLP